MNSCKGKRSYRFGGGTRVILPLRGSMSRALVLMAAVLLFREFLPRRARKSPTAISPYMNSLDGAMSAQQISFVMDELRRQESSVAGVRSTKRPSTAA